MAAVDAHAALAAAEAVVTSFFSVRSVAGEGRGATGRAEARFGGVWG